MKLQTGLVLSSLLSLGVLSYACANGDSVNNGPGGNGGSNNTGGSSSGNSGGSTGGGNNTGNSGGSTGSGNNSGSGGVKATGGSTGTGNTTGNSGGSTGTGNTTGSSGGSTGSGNTTGSSGGSTGGGGSTAATCGTSFAVSPTGFVTMPAQGGACWSGYAFSYVDSYGSTVTPMSPTPGFSTCGSPCTLGITGKILAVTGTSYSYEGLGFNLGDPQSGGGTTHMDVTPKGSGLTIAFSNTTPSTLPLRVQLLDSTMTTWCYTVTGASPVTIPYSSFTQQCYNTPPGTAYAKNPINQIQMQIAGGTTAGDVKVTIMSVTENP